jgi:hypothetical protein
VRANPVRANPARANQVRAIVRPRSPRKKRVKSRITFPEQLSLTSQKLSMLSGSWRNFACTPNEPKNAPRVDVPLTRSSPRRCPFAVPVAVRLT